MPKPSSSAARFVVQTPRRRIMLHVDERRSAARLAPRPRPRTAPPAPRGARASCAEVQPQLEPSLTASSRRDEPRRRAGRAEFGSIRARARATRARRRWSPANAISTAISGNQKSQWYERCVDDRAREHDPEAAADPEDRGDQRRSRAARARGGNSSRMIPNASGKIAPPAPWMTRATIITPIDVASAGEQRARGSTTSTSDQDQLLAVHVAEPARDRRHDRGARAGTRSGSRRRRWSSCSGRAGSSAAQGRRATAAARTKRPRRQAARR